MNGKPHISVIVPVYNAAAYLHRCLEGIRASNYPSFEIIAVDDGSTDESPEIAREYGATVLSMPRQSGPAAARNFGASKARGQILFFTDSDCVVKPDSLERVAADFEKDPNLAAVFGSYDDAPTSPDFLSQFKNLFHHYTHQHSDEQARTFWAGCGAIARDVFIEAGGFDDKRYDRPCIEDVELGVRLWNSGQSILLDKELQVKHLKRWSLCSMVRTDVFDRAVPWTRLMLETSILPKDLNLQISHRISALLVAVLAFAPLLALLPGSGVFGVFSDGLILAAAGASLLGLLILNRDVYAFYGRKRGVKFMLLVIPLHLFYYFYSGVTFVACWLNHKLSKFRSGLRKASA